MNNASFKSGFRNVFLALLTQLVVLVIGLVKSLILPSNMTVSDFGFWQVFIFYVSYIGLFFLGYNDAFLLKYSKKNLDELPDKDIRSGNLVFIAFLTLFSMIVFCLSFIETIERATIIRFFSLSILVWGLYGVLIYIYLATNNIKRYSLFSMLDQIIFLFFVTYSFFSGNFGYNYLIFSMFLSKLIAVILMVIELRKFVFGSMNNLKVSFQYFKGNVKTGIFVMLSAVFSLLMSGFGKIIIDLNGDINRFAGYAFGLSISSLITVFVSAVGPVLLPVLSRVGDDKLQLMYKKMHFVISCINNFGLTVFFALVLVVESYFAKYISLLDYLHFLFLAIMIQNKIFLIYNTYFKILREEKKMLLFYSCSIGFPFIMALLLFSIFDSIVMVSIFTLAAVIILDLLCNRFFMKRLETSVSFIKEYLIYGVFLICCYIPKIGWIIFLGIVIAKLLIDRKEIFDFLSNFRTSKFD